MKLWNVLVEASIQGVKIQGTIACHTNSEESARRLACTSFINQFRRAGIWAYTDVIDEPYEVEVEGPKDKETGKPTKKKETRYKKATRYHAPCLDHMEVIEIIDSGSRDLTFPVEELKEAARYSVGTTMSKTKKRRTSGEVALNARQKKQATITKKEDQLKKKQKAEANKQSKDELMRVVAAYFTGADAKIIKVAAGELNQTYQRVRYALFQIKDKGYNGAEYDLVQTEIDDSKAFRLEKKG